MGSVFGSLGGACATLCACEACKSCLSLGKRSARMFYCLLFFLTMLIAWIMRDYSSKLMSEIPWVEHHLGSNPSKEVLGAQGALRVCCGSFLFYILMSLVLFGVRTKDDARHPFQTDFWCIKSVVWLGCIAVCFFFPNVLIKIFAQMSRVGGACFLLLQVIILLDFVYEWNSTWVGRDTEEYMCLLCTVTLVFYAGALVLYGFIIYWFAAPGCGLNIFFVVFMSLLFVGALVVSLVPLFEGSILPASVVTMYAMYLLFDGLIAQPRDDNHAHCNKLESHFTDSSTTSLVLGLLMTMASVCWSAARAGSKQWSDGEDEEALLSESSYMRAPGQQKMRQEDEIETGPTDYHYSFFHLVFATATMYVAMLLIGWGSYSEDKDVMDVGMPSVWVKVVTSWGVMLLYIWTLVAPHVLPNREF
mmetsp:Transcript_4634/g.16599  ORF Transcript_4634/g.16599 Transcript_4634/m.16599 type:complete len:417 (-) Transcript_4634:2045-3295(-)